MSLSKSELREKVIARTHEWIRDCGLDVQDIESFVDSKIMTLFEEQLPKSFLNIPKGENVQITIHVGKELWFASRIQDELMPMMIHRQTNKPTTTFKPGRIISSKVVKANTFKIVNKPSKDKQMDAQEWNRAYVTHIREIVALIESMADKSPENIIKKLNSTADWIESSLPSEEPPTPEGGTDITIA